MDVQDKVIAITGAAQGLGFEIAMSLLEKGAFVALLDNNEQQLMNASQHLQAFQGQFNSYPLNVSDEQDVEKCFINIVKDFGSLNGLVNNAGITRDSLLVKVKQGKPIKKMLLSDWQQVVDVNLTGVFLCAREAVVQMVNHQCEGVIVNVSSAARVGNYGQSNYAASKAAVVAMAATWAKELSAYGIRSACIAPGFINTALLSVMDQQVLTSLMDTVPLKRAATVKEIAQGVLMIFENDYFNGKVFDLDGGLRL